MDIIDTGERDRPAMVFLHGWPDTAALWDAQVAHFAGRFRCIRFTLPDFGDAAASEGAADFPVLVERIADALRARLSPGESVVLVGHDWGAALSYRLERAHPSLVGRLVTMDVGAHIAPASFGHVAFLVGYQWWLVAAYLVGKILPRAGDAMTRAFARIARAPRAEVVRARSNYLYLYFWRAVLLKRHRATALRGYRPHAPILYLYGERKRFMFHSPQWLCTVESAPGSRAVGLEACGHWLMLDDPARTHALMDEWLDR